MTEEKRWMWAVFIFMLVAWAVLYAVDCLPPLWAEASLAVLAFMFGIPPIISAGKATAKRVGKIFKD